MKKRMSVQALALQLTWIPAAVLMIAVCAVQLLVFRIPEAGSYGHIALFEAPIFGPVTSLGQLGFLLLAVVLAACCSSRRQADFTMTLDRLGISPTEVRIQLGLVFTGYFLIYWGAQFLTLTLLYARFSRSFPGRDPMWYLVAAYRSPYFHRLLPLRDLWGYVRNLTVCLAFGMMTAAAPLRPGKRLCPIHFLPVVCWLVLYQPSYEIRSPGTFLWDMLLSAAALAVTGLALWQIRKEHSHETD